MVHAILIDIPPRLLERIMELAREREESRAAVVRAALREYVRRHPLAREGGSK